MNGYLLLAYLAFWALPVFYLVRLERKVDNIKN